VKYEVTQDIGDYKKGQFIEGDNTFPGFVDLLDEDGEHQFIEVRYLTWLQPVAEKTREELEKEVSRLSKAIDRVRDMRKAFAGLAESYEAERGRDTYRGGKHVAYSLATSHIDLILKGLR
jgi:hypothetical protein